MTGRRCLAILMSIVLVVGLMPMPAAAAVRTASLETQVVGAYDVSNGQYAPYDTVRRLYTRPVTLKTSPDSGQKLYRTVELDLSNPIYDGADLAIRYTGDDPYFVRADAKWANWDWMGKGNDGVRVESADDGTGQKVIFFSRDAFEKRYEAKGVSSAHLYVAVHAQSSSRPADSEICSLVEVVALGGAERIDPKGGSYHEIAGLTRDQIAKDMRAGYNMAGHLDCNWVDREKDGTPIPKKDGGWSYSDLMVEANGTNIYITRETIHALKEKGFNAVRLPTTWFQHIYPVDDPTGDCAARTDLGLLDRYHIDRAWMERVHEVVDWCVAEDMYVILNIHHEDWIDRSDLATAYDETDLPEKFKAVWTQIANEFAGYDQHLVFEDMNEPHAVEYGIDPVTGKYKRLSWGYATAGSVAAVNNLNRDFVTLMRDELEGHQERLLMMAHDTGSGEIATSGFAMPEDSQDLLAISMHCYTPHSWTHYFMDAHEGETGELNVYTESYRHDVETSWAGYRDHYTSQGQTVILGEFGCYYCGEERQQDRLDWMTQYATHAKELGIPMFYWRMDRTETDGSGNKRILWSAFDEEKHEISSKSSALFAKWFEILEDDGIGWGSLAEVEDGEHAAIDEGVQLLCDGGPWSKQIAGSHKSGEESWRVICSNRVDAGVSGGKSRLKWSDVAGKEVAVKFTGSVPRLGCMNDAWGGDSWGAGPDSVDYENGIAYFDSESIALRWRSVVAGSSDSRLAGNTEESVSRILICTATSGGGAPADDEIATTIQQVAIVPIASQQLVAPTCTQPGKKTVGNSGATTIVPALGHSWATSFTRDKAPTLTAAGSKSIHCERCAARKSVTAIPELVDISKAAVTLSATSCVYSGKVQENPAVKKVVLGKKTLSPKSDYTVTNATKSPKAVGDYKVTVTGKGLYGGAKTVTFKINPKGTSLASVKAASRGFTAKWKRQATQTSGYQLQYAPNSKFKSAKTVTVKGVKTLSKKVAKLKAKKKYWVHVRTYKKVGKETYYSAWSGAKAVTTKR